MSEDALYINAGPSKMIKITESTVSEVPLGTDKVILIAKEPAAWHPLNELLRLMNGLQNLLDSSLADFLSCLFSFERFQLLLDRIPPIHNSPCSSFSFFPRTGLADMEVSAFAAVVDVEVFHTFAPSPGAFSSLWATVSVAGEDPDGLYLGTSEASIYGLHG